MIGNDYEKVSKTTKFCFESEGGIGCDHFLEWTDLEEYLIDDNLTVEVKVEILKMTGIGKKENLRKFDELQKEVSDVILVVKDSEFYVSQMYLASQSSFFKTLFLGSFSESNKSEIPLAGIEPEDFQCFLEVLYGESAIYDSTIEGIVSVADLYATPIVVRKCEEFLLKKSEKNFKKKLQMSTQYRLEKLKTQCLSKINTLDDVRTFIPGDLSDLDPSVAHLILQKCVSSQ